MTKMPGEGDIDTQHNGGQVCGKKIIFPLPYIFPYLPDIPPCQDASITD